MNQTLKHCTILGLGLWLSSMTVGCQTTNDELSRDHSFADYIVEGHSMTQPLAESGLEGEAPADAAPSDHYDDLLFAEGNTPTLADIEDIDEVEGEEWDQPTASHGGDSWAEEPLDDPFAETTADWSEPTVEADAVEVDSRTDEFAAGNAENWDAFLLEDATRDHADAGTPAPEQDAPDGTMEDASADQPTAEAHGDLFDTTNDDSMEQAHGYALPEEDAEQAAIDESPAAADELFEEFFAEAAGDEFGGPGSDDPLGQQNYAAMMEAELDAYLAEDPILGSEPTPVMVASNDLEGLVHNGAELGLSGQPTMMASTAAEEQVEPSSTQPDMKVEVGITSKLVAVIEDRRSQGEVSSPFDQAMPTDAEQGFNQLISAIQSLPEDAADRQPGVPDEFVPEDLSEATLLAELGAFDETNVDEATDSPVSAPSEEPRANDQVPATADMVVAEQSVEDIHAQPAIVQPAIEATVIESIQPANPVQAVATAALAARMTKTPQGWVIMSPGAAAMVDAELRRELQAHGLPAGKISDRTASVQVPAAASAQKIVRVSPKSVDSLPTVSLSSMTITGTSAVPNGIHPGRQLAKANPVPAQEEPASAPAPRVYAHVDGRSSSKIVRSLLQSRV